VKTVSDKALRHSHFAH